MLLEFGEPGIDEDSDVVLYLENPGAGKLVTQSVIDRLSGPRAS
ncbi:hypothetical protein [Cryptosporangium sp. NPDC051539]